MFRALSKIVQPFVPPSKSVDVKLDHEKSKVVETSLKKQHSDMRRRQRIKPVQAKDHGIMDLLPSKIYKKS